MGDTVDLSKSKLICQHATSENRPNQECRQVEVVVVVMYH